MKKQLAKKVRSALRKAGYTDRKVRFTDDSSGNFWKDPTGNKKGMSLYSAYQHLLRKQSK